MKIKYLATCILLIGFILILSCVKKEKVEDSYSAKHSLAQLVSEAYTCYQPNSIDLPYGVGVYYGRRCPNNVVSSGFIFNADTKEEVGMEIKATDNTKLYCRTKADETAITGGGIWYKSGTIDSPPPGLWVEFLYSHVKETNIELATAQNPRRSKPLTNYTSNQTLYCFMNSTQEDSSTKYQKLIVR